MRLSTSLLAVNEILRNSARADTGQASMAYGVPVPAGASLSLRYKRFPCMTSQIARDLLRTRLAVMCKPMIEGGSGWVVTYIVA